MTSSNPDSSDVTHVTVNGIEYPTMMYDGVRRFIPNEAVAFVVDNTMETYVLNDLKRALFAGEIPLQDYYEFMMYTGYSVGGWHDAMWSTIEGNPHIFPGGFEKHMDVIE